MESMVQVFSFQRKASMEFKRDFRLQRIAFAVVSNMFFESASMFMLCANSVAIGIQTNYLASNMVSAVPSYLRALDIIFCVSGLLWVFGFEVVRVVSRTPERFNGIPERLFFKETTRSEGVARNLGLLCHRTGGASHGLREALLRDDWLRLEPGLKRGVSRSFLGGPPGRTT